MITLYIGNIHIKLGFSDMNSKEVEYVMQQLHQSLDPLDPNRYRNKAYLTYNSRGVRVWDGRVKIIDTKNHIVPTGLYPELINYLNQLKDSKQYDYQIKDQRGPKLTAKVPDSITIDGNGLEKTITLRDYQYQSVKNAMKEQEGILLEATNSGKCLEKSTKLFTNKGIMTIGELMESYNVNTNSTVPKSFNYEGNIELVNRKGELEKPSKLVRNGVKPIFEIITEVGNSIRITGNNPVLVASHSGIIWKRADELDVGDLLVVRLGSNSYGINNTFSEYDAYGLGLMVADGCYHGSILNFTNNERVLIDYIEKWFSKITGHKPSVSDKFVDGRYSASEVCLRTGNNFDHNTRSLKNEIKENLELGNHLAGDKEVPRSILNAPKKVQLAFLSGYFECEMNYNMTGGRLGIEVTSKSKKLISQVQLMLINMGVISKIRPRKVKGYSSTYYVLEFRAIDGFKLLSLLSFKTNSRQAQKKEYINIFNSKRRNPKGRFVPNGKQLFHEYYKTLSLKERVKAHHVGEIPHTISKYRAIRLLKKFPQGDSAIKSKILEMADLRDFFVKVRSIKNIGNEPTFDVEMPNSHSLLANGIVVHNSVVAISLYKYLLPEVEEGQHLLFIAPNSGIMNQLYTKFRHYLGDDKVGVWGDGKKDLAHPIVCATIQTLASAIKKPKTKPTRKKDKLLERIATKYAPAILEKGSPKANLKLLALNFRPKYKYEVDDVDVLRDLYNSLDTDEDVKGCLESYQKKYKKMLYKLNEKGYKKYYEAVDFLDTVRAVICDEAHYAGAISYWNVFQYLNNARMRIGMTGTLDKSKKIHMARIKSLMGNPIINVTNKQMIDRGVSAKPHIKMVPITQPTDLDAQVGAYMKKNGMTTGGTAGDLMAYQVTYSLGVIHNQYRNHLIAEIAYQGAKRLNKKAVLIIVNSIEHGELISKELDSLGAEYDFIQGKDDTDTRNAVLERVKNGSLKIVIGTKILDAGIDLPNISIYIECSGGKSYITLLQRIGRSLRVMEDKKDVYIFDLWDRTTSGPLYKHGKERLKYYREQGFDVS